MSRYDDPTDPSVVRQEVRHFKQHLVTFLTVVGALAAINMLTGGFWEGNWWFLWVALFWGIGLLFHAMNLFGDGIGTRWEDRMVESVLARRRGESAPSRNSSTYQAPEPPQAAAPSTPAEPAPPRQPPQLPPSSTIYVPPAPPAP